MSLLKGSVNPLNILNARRLQYIPTHFAKIEIPTGKIKEIEKWVYQNLNSRYAIIQSLKIDSDGKTSQIHELGVELAKELTIMSLICPFLDK